MPNPKDVTIKVYYQPGETPNYRFDTTLPTGNGGELIFRNDHFPGFVLFYTLDAASFGDLVFPDDPDQALSSAVIENDGDECPDSGIWDGFEPIRNKSTNQTLAVRNTNGKLPPGKSQVKFGYTLYVTADPNGDPSDFIALDPIGSNQNGPISFHFTSYALAAVVVAAVAAAAYIVLT